MKPAILLVSVSLLAVFFFVALIPEAPAAERIPISPPEPASAPIQIWDDVSPEDLLSMDRSRPFPSESSAASRPRLIGGSFLVYFSFNEGEAALTVRALTGDDRTPSDRYVHYLGDVVDFEPHPTLEQLLLLRTCPAGGQWTALRIGDPVAREMEYCAPRDSQHRWVFDSAEIIRRDDASPLRLISDRSDGQDDDRWTMLPPGTRHYILEDSGIVFVREGKSGIWLKRWRSEEPELLTQESASVIPTAWYIQGADLFYAVKAADGHTEIRTMHVRSGRSRSVTTISGAAGSLNSFVLDEKAGRLYASMETGG